MSDIKVLISSLAVVSTVLQFLSGILVCRHYVKNRTTAESSPLPFLSGILSCGLWLLYGLTKRDDKIVLVNTIGLTLMSCYTAVFYIYTFKKSSLLKEILFTIGLLMFMTGYVFVEDNHDVLINRLGLLACALTLFMVAAPMTKLAYVLKVKTTECLPFPMILMSFFVSLFWFLYGTIVNDPYLLMPNFIGGVLAALQLSLFLIYPNTPQSPITMSILA